MRTRWPIQDAKNQFSKVVDVALSGAPQVVTRRGAPVVVVVAVEQYNLPTKRGRTENGFAKFLLSMPTGTEKSGAGGQGHTAFGLREVAF